MTEEAATKKSSTFGKGCLIAAGVLVGLVVIGAVVGGEGEEGAGTAQTASTEPPVAVSSTELARAYAANEMAAKQQYGDRVLEVTGTIRSIDLDFMDEPVVMLPGTDDFTKVHASLADSHHDAAATLSKGQQITVTCTELSEVMGSPMLDECTF